MEYNKQKFEQIYKGNYQQMYRLAYTFVLNTEEARDIVSQVFARMWQNQPDIEDQSMTAYLLTAVRNQSLHSLHHRQRRADMEEELRYQMLQPQDNNQRELLQQVQQIIRERLTEQDRRVLDLHFGEEMTYSETGQALGISTAAVNKHITQSLNKIRNILKISKA